MLDILFSQTEIYTFILGERVVQLSNSFFLGGAVSPLVLCMGDNPLPGCLQATDGEAGPIRGGLLSFSVEHGE